MAKPPANPSVDRQALLLAALLVLIVAALLGIAYLGYDTLSSVRAYVGGEGLWSKAQKDAVHYLTRYGSRGDEQEYRRFRAALEAPLGDRRARLELEKPNPDLAVAYEGLLLGGNHPEDVERMATFFRRFRRVSYVNRAIEIWAEGDEQIARLAALGDALHVEINTGSPEPGRVEEILAEVDQLNSRLTTLEEAFSATLAEGARWAQGLLRRTMVVAGALLVTLGGVISWRTVRRIRASEEALRHSWEKDRTLLESIQEGYYEVDLDGNLTLFNSALTQILGYGPDELRGMNTRRYMTTATAARVKEAFRSARETGQPCHEFDWEVIGKDGTRRVVEASVAPIRDRRGTTTGFRGVVRDITERRASEAALRRSEANYRTLYEQATQGIYRSTPEGRFVAANPAVVRMLGYRSEAEVLELELGRDVYVDPEEREQLVDRNRDLVDSVTPAEVRWKRKDGRQIRVHLTGRPVRRPDGSLDYFEMFVEDVTTRRQLEEQLRQAQKMEALGHLTGGIAHDFNNLLTVIIANADLLAQSLSDGLSEERAGAEEVRLAARRGAAMVRKLLAFSRQEKLEFTTIDPGRVVGEATTMLRRLLPETIHVESVIREPLPAVRADVHAVHQILLNLGTNSRDAMPDGGTLRIEVTQGTLDEDQCRLRGWGEPGTYVLLQVDDTGCGMDAVTLARIFEPFFTTKPPGVGTGLGMSMVYGLVKQHSGFVDVTSARDAGTSIRIYLPPASAEHVAGTPPRPTSVRGGQETVLVVEDEDSIRRAVERILPRFGYRVLTASDGLEALDILQQGGDDVDLILSDVVMPRMSGPLLHDELRRRGAPFKFLFMSGYPRRDFVEGLEPGVPFLQKPWTVSELVAWVRETLDRPVPTAAPRA